MDDRLEALTILAGHSATPDAFFEAATRALTLGLDTEMAAIGHLQPDGRSVLTLAILLDGKMQPVKTYDLDGTPCCDVYDTADVRPHILIPDGVAEQFPDDVALARMGARSYRAEVFRDGDGVPVGHVFVIGREPVVEDENDTAFFRLVAQRVGAEFNRQAAEAQLSDSERRFRAVIEHSPNGIVLKDSEGRYRVMNATFESWLGVSANAAIGKTTHDLFTPEQAAMIAAHEQQVRDSGRVIVAERTTEYPDGQSRVTLTQKFPVADGADTGIGSVNVDITALKLAQRELVLAKEMAEDANRAKSDFLARMSHELRTPLNSIIGFSSLIASNEAVPSLRDKIGEYASDIQRSGTYLLGIIDDILDISRIEAGEMPVEREEIFLQSVIDDCIAMIGASAQQKGVSIETEAKNGDPWVVCDPRHARQIVINILGNAVKFTEPEGRVRVELTGREGGIADVHITDTGCGIDAEDLTRIMEPFSQAGGSYTRESEGSGLGLAIAGSLAKLNGASLAIDSTPGKGTSVKISFSPEMRCEG